MELLVFMLRCIVMILITWVCLRILGKRSIAQMTSFDLAFTMVLANITAEPLVYKNVSKQFIGAMTITLLVSAIGYLALKKWFYNFDAKPNILITNGKVDKDEMKKNKMNLPFLLSLMRIQGYARVSDIEFAILEPNGHLSIIPKSQNRPVTPNDLKINTQYEGLSLPLIIDGEIQMKNLEYANIDISWLENEINKMGAPKVTDVFLAELDTVGSLYVDLYSKIKTKPSIT